MKTSSQSFLEELLDAHGPSGWESGVQKRWLDYVKRFADETGSDAYGNAYAILNPDARPRILVAGHADEIGYQVQHIDNDGFVWIVRVGGTDVALARGHRVLIHGKKGPVTGVIGTVPIHLQEKKGEENAVKIHELFVDIGARNKTEASKRISVGDPITFKVSWDKLNEDTYTARAADNRIGIFAAAEALRLCSEFKKLKACIIAVSTIQEENGLYGAGMVAQSLRPDAAIVVDVGHATDTPVCNARKHGEIKLGGGPMLSRGSVNHPVLVERLQKAAAKGGIPVQMAVDPRWSGTDADAIFSQLGGIPSAVVSLPNRYMHSTVEVFSKQDLSHVSGLIATFAASVSANESFHVKIS